MRDFSQILQRAGFILVCVLTESVCADELVGGTGEPDGSYWAHVDHTIYVDDDAPAGGAGDSWDTAYTYLQDALMAATSLEGVVEIRIGQGRYLPDAGGGWILGDRSATFRMTEGMVVRGGYAGRGNVDPNKRDSDRFRTALSGDIDPDEHDVDITAIWPGYLSSLSLNHAFHVLTLGPDSNDVLLEGLWVMDGTALETTGENGAGGGLHLDGCENVSLVDCHFLNNLACVGGAVHCSGDPVFDECTFEGNVAGEGGGGVGILKGSPRFVNCGFMANRSINGGAMVIFNGNPQLERCRFLDNRAGAINTADAGFGGAVWVGYRYRRSELLILDCSFIGNLAASGGAVNSDHGEILFIRCAFYNNLAGSGGAVSGIAGNLTFEHSILCGNEALRGIGGAIVIRYRTIRRNYVYVPGTLELLNCTLVGNRAPRGAHVSARAPVNLTITNSILRDGGIDLGESSNGPSSIHLAYTNLSGLMAFQSHPSAIDLGPGNMDYDPGFLDPGYWDIGATVNDPADDIFVVGDYHLKSEAGHWDSTSESWIRDDITSPGINAGDPIIPIGEEPEPHGGRINMGAYGGTAEASLSIDLDSNSILP
jgi:hypothetical protein